MELKPYQKQVIADLSEYFSYLQKAKNPAKAFNAFWQDKTGIYNPIAGEGMRPYQDNVEKAVHLCIKVPTAGGKTFIACHALKTIFDALPPERPKAVVWLVPWSNLLDQTVIVYGSPMADGNIHNHRRCPLLLLGKGNGRLPGNMHLKAPDATPMANVMLGLLHQFGCNDVKSFGDSTDEFTLSV